MLEAIERNGSIQAAAKELKMSYRALWGRITATEKRMGRQLLTRNVGGSSGGGSRLTPFAKTLLESFREIHRRIAVGPDHSCPESARSPPSPERVLSARPYASSAPMPASPLSAGRSLMHGLPGDHDMGSSMLASISSMNRLLGLNWPFRKSA
ncbi:winged helix-turn-helix domain-containing protein [Desulfatirhabdium butyrativorans]|uniref:winged helix-turn-helix domain-containing protein n=1 Tax=Desulfatirhabdium butyrativorans TaxID=340467 RepID=UPI001FE224A4|nr:LysR family transcriptional regulator [Desulfatirhabdium butyrativorans]